MDAVSHEQERMAPRVVAVEDTLVSSWPETVPRDWCGEWSRKEGWQ